MDYQRYLRSAHWQSLRLRKLSEQPRLPRVRLCYLCDHCRRFIHIFGINVHHRTYERLGRERLDDLEVLCEGCHCIEHKIDPPAWWRRYPMRPWDRTAYARLYVQYEREGLTATEAMDLAIAITAVVIDDGEFETRPIGDVMKRWLFRLEASEQGEFGS